MHALIFSQQIRTQALQPEAKKLVGLIWQRGEGNSVIEVWSGVRVCVGLAWEAWVTVTAFMLAKPHFILPRSPAVLKAILLLKFATSTASSPLSTKFCTSSLLSGFQSTESHELTKCWVSGLIFGLTAVAIACCMCVCWEWRGLVLFGGLV